MDAAEVEHCPVGRPRSARHIHCAFSPPPSPNTLRPHKHATRRRRPSLPVALASALQRGPLRAAAGHRAGAHDFRWLRKREARQDLLASHEALPDEARQRANLQLGRRARGHDESRAAGEGRREVVLGHVGDDDLAVSQVQLRHELVFALRNREQRVTRCRGGARRRAGSPAQAWARVQERCPPGKARSRCRAVEGRWRG